MEVRWISALVGERAPFFIFKVKVCRGGAQVVVAAPRAIKSPRLKPHLGGNVKRLVGVVWSSRISSGCGDLRIVKELHRQFFLLRRLRNGCGLLDPFGDFPSATNVRPTQGGAAAAARRRYGLEVEDEGLLKELVIIFIFFKVLYTVCYFFNIKVLSILLIKQNPSKELFKLFISICKLSTSSTILANQLSISSH
jgi:hypothetical protein